MPEMKEFNVTYNVTVERSYVVSAYGEEDAKERVRNGGGELDQEVDASIFDFIIVSEVV
jgi:hypothetical protein